jgi:hypothetical protein
MNRIYEVSLKGTQVAEYNTKVYKDLVKAHKVNCEERGEGI